MIQEPPALWNKLLDHYGKYAGESRYIGRAIGKEMACGAEYQLAGTRYAWNGLRRPGRWMAFQWTIEGEGLLRVGSETFRLPEGHAFLVTIPSDHEYRVLDRGPGWKFFFIRINNQLVIDMLIDVVDEVHNTFPLAFTSRLAAETLQLIQAAYGGTLNDPFNMEKALFSWMVEMKRHLHQLRFPHTKRDEVLQKAEDFYKEHKAQSFGVEDFAKALSMSRVGVSLLFRKHTGLTLAAYFLELRLRDAVALLSEGHKLDHVARETGFADANHLCKVFRRIYHTTPAQFRDMIGAKETAEI